MPTTVLTNHRVRGCAPGRRAPTAIGNSAQAVPCGQRRWSSQVPLSLDRRCAVGGRGRSYPAGRDRRVMRASGVGRVVASRHAAYATGDLVAGGFGMQGIGRRPASGWPTAACTR
jgi:hypothetical protein